MMGLLPETPAEGVLTKPNYIIMEQKKGLTTAESAEFHQLSEKIFQGASFVTEDRKENDRYDELMYKIQRAERADRARKADLNRPTYVIPVYDKTKSLYWNWNEGRISNFGSFQTTILQAYRIADLENRSRMEVAFFEWFTTPEVEEYLEN